MRRTKEKRKIRRKLKIRAKIFGTAEKPRLSVFRSLNHIYAQIINDLNGETLVAASDLEFKKSKEKGKKSDLKGKIVQAYNVGLLLAEKALKNKIKKVVFDRNGFLYHGRIKALADGAREGGLQF